MNALMQLNGKDVISKDKQKTKELAEKFLDGVNIEEVFKDPPKKSEDQQGQ